MKLVDRWVDEGRLPNYMRTVPKASGQNLTLGTRP